MLQKQWDILLRFLSCRILWRKKYRRTLPKTPGIRETNSGRIICMGEKAEYYSKIQIRRSSNISAKPEQYLYNYLLDGRKESSNNRAELSVKPFVISRKKFLFANTANRATESSIIFSLIETAKENKLDPYRYLTYVLKFSTELNQGDDKRVEQLLPENALESCKLNYIEK